MLIIVVPASVRIIGVSSPTIIIFLNESSILRNEASSCLNFSSKISRPINYHIYYQKLCLVTLFSNAKSGLFSEFAKFSCLFPSFSLFIYIGKCGMFLGIPYSVGVLSPPTEGDR